MLLQDLSAAKVVAVVVDEEADVDLIVVVVVVDEVADVVAAVVVSVTVAGEEVPAEAVEEAPTEAVLAISKARSRPLHEGLSASSTRTDG